jgi:hypothetical protein
MKIAIKGHESRGKEVIQFLESLGGRNQMLHTGRYTGYFYYINNDNIITWTSVRPRRSNIFTLEEFEKEFPFKIGDKVKHITSIGTIKEYCYINNEPAYKVKSIELGIIATIPAKILEPYKEMKEERNITLTLEKAKEWYKKGGELKEIALQAFTETELNTLPRSWEEFCKRYPIKKDESYINSEGKILSFTTKTARRDWNHICPSKQSAEAHLAMIQLEQLRNCWRQGWEPIWDISHKWCIRLWGNELGVGIIAYTSRFLTFPTKEMAEEFLKCFRDLIEKAGDLI